MAVDFKLELNEHSLDALIERIADEVVMRVKVLLAERPTPRPKIDPEQPYMISSRAACQLLGIAHTTLWRWRRAGRIKGVQLGPSTVRYRIDDIRQLEYLLKKSKKNR